MSYLFYIDERNDGVVLRPDCIKLCPELSVLDEKETLLIILVYDYHSIYRQFPEPERKRKAMIHVYGENVSEKFEELTIKRAIEAYKSLQYIPDIELAAKYQRKINTLTDLIDSDDTATGSKKNLETIKMFQEAIRDLEKRASESMINKGQIQGKQELSLLEDLMRNQKYYKSVIEKK